MTERMLTCAMCGYSFLPEGQERCKSCPIGVDCSLACCPACGYEVVNLEQSWLARWLSRRLPATARPSASRLTESSTLNRRGEF